jgi:hypothetical protein
VPAAAEPYPAESRGNPPGPAATVTATDLAVMGATLADGGLSLFASSPADQAGTVPRQSNSANR